MTTKPNTENKPAQASATASAAIRLDKWLWCVRLFKTRQQATDGCRLKRVLMAGNEVKPSRIVQLGDVYEVEQEDCKKTVKVVGLLGKRVAGKLVEHYLEDLTDPAIYAAASERRTMARLTPVVAPQYRPNKHDRQLIKDLFEPFPDSDVAEEEDSEDGR